MRRISSAERFFSSMGTVAIDPELPWERHMQTVADLVEVGMNMSRILRRQVENGDREAKARYPYVAGAMFRAIGLQTVLEAQLLDHAQPHPRPARLPAPADAKERARRWVEKGDREAFARYPVIAHAMLQQIAYHAARQSPRARPARPPADDRERARRRKAQLRSLVEDAIKCQAADRRTIARRRLKLDAWLESPALDADLGKRTIGEVAVHICRKLRVTPDIDTWPPDVLWEDAIRD